MAVLPINRVNAGNHTVSFQARKKTDENIGEGKTNNSQAAGKMVTVPVAVLMALATTSLNAKAPASSNFDKNIDQTELLAYASPSEIGEASTASAKTKDYYTYLNNLKRNGRVIKTIEVPGRRESYTMVLLRDEPRKKNQTDCCDKVIMLSHLHENKDENGNFQNAPEVSQFVYHNIGTNEYCGVVVDVTRKVDDELVFIKYEIKLPDDAADVVIDLLANDNDYVNLTDIQYVKTTDAKLMPMKVF